MEDETELALLRKEAAHLRLQLAQVKRADDLELNKLYDIAGMVQKSSS